VERVSLNCKAGYLVSQLVTKVSADNTAILTGSAEKMKLECAIFDSS